MNDINELYDILKNDNIKTHENELFELIPELKFEKGFEQKNKWHSYDVWDHTLITIQACDNNLLDRLVMLLHDIGKPFSYQDEGNVRHFHNHALKSAEMAKTILDRFNICESNKKLILDLIKLHSTKIDLNKINLENKDFYKRLLKIQKCDAMGYEEEHSKKIINELNTIKIKCKK